MNASEYLEFIKPDTDLDILFTVDGQGKKAKEEALIRIMDSYLKVIRFTDGSGK